MKYIIQKADRKTTATGKDKIDATLDDSTKLIEGVTIWGDFPGFAYLVIGQSIEGDVVEKQNGQYTNRTLYAPKTPSTTPQRGAGAITKAMDKKAENIEKAQDNKSLGVKISATMGHAVNIVLAQIKDDPIRDEGAIKQMITNWRKWLWENWDKEEKDFDPFPSNRPYVSGN